MIPVDGAVLGSGLLAAAGFMQADGASSPARGCDLAIRFRSPGSIGEFRRRLSAWFDIVWAAAADGRIGESRQHPSTAFAALDRITVFHQAKRRAIAQPESGVGIHRYKVGRAGGDAEIPRSTSPQFADVTRSPVLHNFGLWSAHGGVECRCV